MIFDCWTCSVPTSTLSSPFEKSDVSWEIGADNFCFGERAREAISWCFLGKRSFARSDAFSDCGMVAQNGLHFSGRRQVEPSVAVQMDTVTPDAANNRQNTCLPIKCPSMGVLAGRLFGEHTAGWVLAIPHSLFASRHASVTLNRISES